MNFSSTPASPVSATSVRSNTALKIRSRVPKWRSSWRKASIVQHPFSPSNVAPTFSDAVGHWAEDWIEALKNDGITVGCATGLYCPENPVTRAQMAVFLLKAKYGSSYTPPVVGVSTGFGDVPTNHWAAAWIKQLVIEGITAGCGSGNYCPDMPVSRTQMAVFLVKSFNLPCRCEGQQKKKR